MRYSFELHSNGFASAFSAGYAYFIPKLCTKSVANVPLSVSACTAECSAILEALKCVFSLPVENYLIVSDSQASIQTIVDKAFLLKCLAFVFQICCSLKLINISIGFLWVSGHIDIIGGNQYADQLAS